MTVLVLWAALARSFSARPLSRCFVKIFSAAAGFLTGRESSPRRRSVASKEGGAAHRPPAAGRAIRAADSGRRAAADGRPMLAESEPANPPAPAPGR